MADTVWPLGSGNAGLSFEVPIDGLVNLTGDLLHGFIEHTMLMLESYLKLGFAALGGESSSELANQAKQLLEESWTDYIQPTLEDVVGNLGNTFAESTLATEFSLNMLGEGSENTVEGLVLAASIPIGEAISSAFDPQFWSDTANGLTAMLPTVFKEALYGAGSPPALPAQELFGDIPANTTFSVQIVPGLPTSQLYTTFSANVFTDLVIASSATFNAMLDGMIDAVKMKSFGPLTSVLTSDAVKNSLNTLEASIREDIIVGLGVGIGANGDIGAEGKVSIGAGASMSIESNLEMLLYLGSLGLIDHGDAEGEASFAFDMSVEGEAGVSIGEGVEFSAGGGLSYNTSLLSITLSESSGRTPHHAYVPESSDATLKSIFVGQGLALNEAFSPSTYYYTVDIPYEFPFTQVDIRAETNNASAKLWVNNKATPNGALTTIPLDASGVNLIEIKTTSMDGSQNKTYYVEARRKANTKLLSVNIKVGVDGPTLPITIPSTGTTLTMDVPSDTYDVKVMVEGANPAASITINGASSKNKWVYVFPGQ